MVTISITVTSVTVNKMLHVTLSFTHYHLCSTYSCYDLYLTGEYTTVENNMPFSGYISISCFY